MAERPSLVTIIAFLIFLAALVLVLAGVVCAAIDQSMWDDVVKQLTDGGYDIGDLTLSSMHTLGYMMIVGGIAAFIVGYALWKGWTIAWYLTVILFIAGIISSIYSIVIGAWPSVITIAIILILTYYMFRPKVKEFFKV